MYKYEKTYIYIYIYVYIYVGGVFSYLYIHTYIIVSRVCINDQGDRCSIQGRVMTDSKNGT